MTRAKATTAVLFAVSASVDVAAGTLGESLENKDLSSAPQLSWETAVGLPNRHAESQYYAALLMRSRNKFFGWPSYRVYEVASIARTACSRCTSGSALETLMVGVSEQFEIVSTQHLTLEVGLGGYLKKPTDPVGSVFTFGERIALISQVNNLEIEVFYRHFSNGSFTSDNSGYDFVGLSFHSSF